MRRCFLVSKELLLQRCGLDPTRFLLYEIETQHRPGECVLVVEDLQAPNRLPEGFIPKMEAIETELR